MSEARKEIKEQLYIPYPETIYLDIEMFDAPVDKIIDTLQKLKTIFPKHKDLQFDISVYYDYASSPDVKLFGTRLETDKEYNRRIAKNKKDRIAAAKRREQQQATKEAREQREYERLKKKYDNN